MALKLKDILTPELENLINRVTDATVLVVSVA
jgi:hypothetical protein